MKSLWTTKTHVREQRHAPSRTQRTMFAGNRIKTGLIQLGQHTMIKIMREIREQKVLMMISARTCSNFGHYLKCHMFLQ